MPYECNEFKIARPKFSKKRKQVGCWNRTRKAILWCILMYIVHGYMHVFADQIHNFSLLKRRRSPKIAEMPKEVACRDVFSRCGQDLGRIIKQCQGWGTSSRSTWGSLEVSLMNSVLQNSMFAIAWHRLKFIECHKYLQEYVHELHEYVCMHVDTYILRDFCRVKDLGLKLRMEITGNRAFSGLLELVHKENKAGLGIQHLESFTKLWFLELEHLMIFDVFDVFWKISAYTWVKNTVSGPPPAALGPPVPRNQRLLGRTPSPARPVPEGPEKPEPRAGGASTWTKDANGESVFLSKAFQFSCPWNGF